jgi:hypothetical protein
MSYFTKKQQALFNLTLETAMGLEYPTKQQENDPFHIGRQLKNVNEITKGIAKMGVIPASVCMSFNNSKTDFSSFDRLYFRIKRGIKKSNKDRLDSGSYIVTGQFVTVTKGGLKGEPNLKKGWAEDGLQISKLPPAKRKGQTPSQYEKVIKETIKQDFHPAFLHEYLHLIYLYGLILNEVARRS